MSTSTTFDGVTRQHVWDETSTYGDVILDLDGNGAAVNGYTLAGNRIVAQTDANHTASYFLQDALGSTRGLTSGSTLTQSYNYDAFGTLLGDVGSLATNYLFAGQQYDSATGLYSMRARYYDPGVGRFFSRDTWAINYADPVELNRYVYAANNPTNRIDPSGHFSGGYSTIHLPSLSVVGALSRFGGALGIGLLSVYVRMQAFLLWFNALTIEQILDHIYGALSLAQALGYILEQLDVAVIDGELPQEDTEGQFTESDPETLARNEILTRVRELEGESDSEHSRRKHIALGLSRLEGSVYYDDIALFNFTASLNVLLRPLAIDVYWSETWQAGGISTTNRFPNNFTRH